MFLNSGRLAELYAPVRRSVDHGRRHLREFLINIRNHDVSATFTRARRASYWGIFSVLVFAVSWITAVVLDGSWAYGVNMVSDLGVSASFGARIAFTIGCVVGGLGFMAYGYSVMRSCSRPLVKLTYAMSMLAGLCLIGVGLFNEMNLLHYPFALSLGGLAISAIIISIADDLIQHRNESALKTMLIFAVFIISLVGTRPFAEATAIIALLTWIFVKCTSFVRSNRI